MLGSVLLRASRSDRARRLTTSVPVTRKVVDRFVAGEDEEAALSAIQTLITSGLSVTIDRLGEDVADRAQADHTADAYIALLSTLADRGWGHAAEVSVKLSAVGQSLGAGSLNRDGSPNRDGHSIALDNARRIAAAAAQAGTTMTVDMEDHATTDSTLGIVTDLRREFDGIGTVLQSMLRRTESDCRDLAVAGSRIRLVKGAYKEPADVAFQDKADVDASYERCLTILMKGAGYPMIGSHDPSMISHALALVESTGRSADSYEFQMLYGIRTDEQRRLRALGHRMRIYVPYGEDWYGYFMRRLAERPANVGFFLRALVGR